MDILSFQIPIMGSSYIMYLDTIKFYFNNNNITFYSVFHNEPMICKLYKTYNHHKEIISFLQEEKNHSTILLERINKHKYIVSFHKNFENILFITSMLKKLFCCSHILLESCISNNQYSLGKCSFHLFDLYEMGYMSLNPVVFHYPLLFNSYETKIFTGIFLNARRPFYKYQYDYIELNYSNHLKQDFFLKLSFDMMLQDRPELIPSMTQLIGQLLKSIPFQDEKTYNKHLKNWNTYNDLKVCHREFKISLEDWSPDLFLKVMNRLLDMFPSYYIEPKLTLYIGI